MTYVFDVSSEHNDLMEVNYYVLYEGFGDYRDLNRVVDGHTIYNVEFCDKRYALQFKLMFTATVVKWDESDDTEMVSIEDLLERGYVEVRLKVLRESVPEFKEWCETLDFPIVDEIKFVGTTEPFSVYVPEAHQATLILRWNHQ